MSKRTVGSCKGVQDSRHLLRVISPSATTVFLPYMQVDLVKDSGHLYFIKYLDSSEPPPTSRAQAAFVLAVICDEHPRGQSLCAGANLLGVCLPHLLHIVSQLDHAPEQQLLAKWLCLCAGKLCENMPEVVPLPCCLTCVPAR